jgi:hypothetical protein
MLKLTDAEIEKRIKNCERYLEYLETNLKTENRKSLVPAVVAAYSKLQKGYIAEIKHYRELQKASK